MTTGFNVIYIGIYNGIIQQNNKNNKSEWSSEL